MRLLVLASRFPYPLEKGDKLRLYHQLRELARHHEVILCCLTDKPVSPDALAQVKPFCSHISVIPLHKGWQAWGVLSSFFKGEPLQLGYFHSPKAFHALSRLIRDFSPDHIFCQLVRMAPYAAQLSVPVTIDFMDAFSAGMHRRALKAPWWLKPLFFWESKALARAENRYLRQFSRHCIISGQDRDCLPSVPGKPIAVVPNGVDTGFFAFERHPAPVFDVAFVGNLGYFPNRQAALTLIHEVMPRVWANRPEARVLLAGARPAPELRALAADPRISVPGWVPDIRQAYLSASVMAAPLFTGSGQQNKILEAMALGVPCITTQLVNNALHATAGQHLLVAEDAAGFADGILDLLTHPGRAETIRHAARDWVQNTYSWQASVAALEPLFAHPNP